MTGVLFVFHSVVAAHFVLLFGILGQVKYLKHMILNQWSVYLHYDYASSLLHKYCLIQLRIWPAFILWLRFEGSPYLYP